MSVEKLPPEIEFEIAKFNNMVSNMSCEQCDKMLRKLYVTYKTQEYLHRKLLAKQWGINERS